MRFALVKKGRGSNLYVSACDYWVCRGAKSWKIGLLPPTRSSCSFCVSLPHATREKCTDARPYFVSHVLLSWQNGQSTAEDGVTPAVKVATHTAPHTHTHTHTLVQTLKTGADVYSCQQRKLNLKERLFFGLKSFCSSAGARARQCDLLYS